MFAPRFDSRIVDSGSELTYSEILFAQSNDAKYLADWVCKRTTLPIEPIIEKMISDNIKYTCVDPSILGVVLVNRPDIRSRFIAHLRRHGAITKFSIADYIPSKTTTYNYKDDLCSVGAIREMIVSFHDAGADMTNVSAALIGLNWSDEVFKLIGQVAAKDSQMRSEIDESCLELLCKYVPLNGLLQLEGAGLIDLVGLGLTQSLLSEIAENPDHESIFRCLITRKFASGCSLDRSALSGMFSRINRDLLQWTMDTRFEGKSIFEHAIDNDTIVFGSSAMMTACLRSPDHKLAIELFEQLKSRIHHPITRDIIFALPDDMPHQMILHIVSALDRLPRSDMKYPWTTAKLMTWLLRTGDTKLANRIWELGTKNLTQSMLTRPLEYGGEHMITALNWSYSKGARILYSIDVTKFADLEKGVKWLIDHGYNVRDNILPPDGELIDLKYAPMRAVRTIREILAARDVESIRNRPMIIASGAATAPSYSFIGHKPLAD